MTEEDEMNDAARAGVGGARRGAKEGGVLR